MNNLFEKVKENASVLEVITYFWQKPNRQNKVTCPFHKEKTPSLSIDVNNNYWKCFGCGKSGDAIDFVAELKDLDLLEAAKLIADAFNIRYEDNAQPKKISIPEYLKKCIDDVDKTDYFKKRGLTDETIKRFNLGFDTQKNSVTIPYSKRLAYFQSRNIYDKRFYKPRTQDAGAEPIYNEARIRANCRDVIFVVESPICAMSIEQCGACAIATCGTGGWRKAAEKFIKVKYKGGIILCFDNDEPGQQASFNMANMLFENNLKHIMFNIADKKKDPNELLMANKDALVENIRKAKHILRKKYATNKDSFTSADLSREVIPPTQWIVKDMLPIGLAILSAQSKARKSWMMMQLCFALSHGGQFLNHQCIECETLYYSLEDDKGRLKGRQNKMLHNEIGSEKVHFVTESDKLDTGLLDKVEEELDEYPDIKLVVFDTLQRVRGKLGRDNTLYGNEYEEMTLVKDFADKHKICVLFVHHLRKMADDSDVFNMISGSVALMGAADTAFIISKKKRTDEDAIFTMTGRDIEQKQLVINFNNLSYNWEVVGSAEEVQMQREREEYEKNPLVRTIKELVKRNPMGGWSGTTTDLMKEIFNVTNERVVESSSSLGRAIKKYEYRLYCDGIKHTERRSSSRIHEFTKILKEKPVYQQCLYD